MLCVHKILQILYLCAPVSLCIGSIAWTVTMTKGDTVHKLNHFTNNFAWQRCDGLTSRIRGGVTLTNQSEFYMIGKIKLHREITF